MLCILLLDPFTSKLAQPNDLALIKASQLVDATNVQLLIVELIRRVPVCIKGCNGSGSTVLRQTFLFTK